MFDTIRFASRLKRLMTLPRRSAQEIVAVQEHRFRRFLRHAADHSPFYRERLRGLDLARCSLTDVPTLTKSEMMANFDDIVTDRRIHRADVERFIADPANLSRRYLGRYAVCHTSGSQGQPAIVVQEGLDILMGVTAQVARGGVIPDVPFLWHVLSRIGRPGRMAVVTQQPGFYPSGAVFTHLAAARFPFLRVRHLSIFAPVEETVARLNEFQPEYLIGYTSSLEVLAREVKEGRLHLTRLRGLTNTSEPLPDVIRERVETAFGVRVSDCYMMAECLALTTGCPHSGGAHVNSDLAVLEVVDDDFRPVPDGTAGSKVLVTNLYNRVLPLIRYVVGDVVTMSARPCPCGSPFPLVESVGGRTKERFWVEAGARVREIPYYLFLAGLHHCTDLAEHQVLQTGRNQFVVLVAPQPGKVLSAARIEQLVRRSVAAEGLADRLRIDIEVVNEIPRDPATGKMTRARNVIGLHSIDRKLGTRTRQGSEDLFESLERTDVAVARGGL